MSQNNDDESLSAKADAAFRQASVKVIQKAKQTGTLVVIWENGQLKRIPPEHLELLTTRPETPRTAT